MHNTGAEDCAKLAERLTELIGKSHSDEAVQEIAELLKKHPELRELVPETVLRQVDTAVVPNRATVGNALSTNYRKTFFDAHPHLEGKVVVHHGIEQQVLDLYPGRFTASEIHSLENLRGTPVSINSEVHLSKIRKEWNKFYRNNPNATRQQLLDEATRIDNLFGSQFDPPL